MNYKFLTYYNKKFIYYILLLATLTIIAGTIFLATKTHQTKKREPINILTINKNIHFVNVQTKKEYTVDLPTRLPTGEYYCTLTLNGAPKHSYLFIKGQNLSFQASCSENIFFQYTPPDTNIIKSGGDFIKVFKLPENCDGKEIRLDFQPAVPCAYGMTIPDMYIGLKSDLMIHNPTKKNQLFIYIMFMIVFTILSFIIAILLYGNKKANFQSFLVPLFSFINASYLASTTPPFYVLMDKGPVVYIWKYVFFMLLPICIAIFFIAQFRESNERNWKVQALELLSYGMCLNLVVQTALTFFGIKEFIEMKQLSYLLMFTFFGLLMLLSFTKRKKTKVNTGITITLAIISLNFIIVMSDFILSSRLRLSSLVIIPSTIFLLLQAWIAMNAYYRRYRTICKAKFYEELAFTDPLTNLANRNAIERDFKEIKERIGEHLMLMIIDINNLKYINDTFGHKTGDYIIGVTADILNNTMSRFPHLCTYRLGGDEFAIISSHFKEDEEEIIRQDIEHQMRAFQEKKPTLQFSLAIGSMSVEISEHFNAERLLQKTDSAMYEDKKQKKQNNKANKNGILFKR